MNYRTVFKKHYNIDFGNDYEIHHIDLNHDNNDISNLMILPKELHNKYHKLLNEHEETSHIRSFYVIPTGNSLCCETMNLNFCEQLIPVIKEMNIWIDYKSFLDGKLTNIHNIKL